MRVFLGLRLQGVDYQSFRFVSFDFVSTNTVSPFLLVNTNETSIARGQKALDHSLTRSLDGL